MLLTVMQCIGQSPTMKNYLVQDINDAKVGKPCFRAILEFPPIKTATN